MVRLALTLVLVVWPLARLVRRHRPADRDPASAFLLAGIFGLLALAAHSFVDFGLHLPAIAVLATVFLAAVLAAAEAPPAVRPQRPVLACVGALGLLGIAGLLAWDGLTAYQAEQCRSATVGMTLQGPPSLPQAERAVRLMAAASAARPDNALYHHELGQAYLTAPSTGRPDPPRGTATCTTRCSTRRLRSDLSPLLSPTQARLGRYRDLFASADPALAYFERARSLLPTDATMIFFDPGLSRWEAGDVAVPARTGGLRSATPRCILRKSWNSCARVRRRRHLRDVVPDQPGAHSGRG